MIAPVIDPVLRPASQHGLRVVGDVHGDARAFDHACATSRFVLQLGDLVDGGPDSAGALKRMLALVEAGRGAMVIGNHDWMLLRGLRNGAPAGGIVPPALSVRIEAMLAAAPFWLTLGSALFAHAAFHPAMLGGAAPEAGAAPRHPRGALARALYGQPTGRTRPDGFPERSLAWIDQVPDGMRFYCGHDQRSRDGRPLWRHGRAGGAVLFLDTGAGKGGHLSWIDLDPPDFTPS